MNAKIFLRLFPALFVICAFFGGGLFLTAANNLSFAAYKTVLLDREVQSAFVFTLYFTAVSTALSAAFGLLLAIAVHKQTGKSALLKTLLQIPLAVPHLAAAFVLLNFIQPSGLIARFFVAQPQDFPIIVNDAFGLGIIAAYVLKETPFVALVVLATLARTGGEFEIVAQNLGANSWQRFRFVTLPLISPALGFASLIVFAFVFGAFEIPFVLGRQFPTALAVVGSRKFFSTDIGERPAAFALAVLMTAAASVFVLIYLRLTRNAGDGAKTTLF